MLFAVARTPRRAGPATMPRPFDPIHDILQLQERMNRLFEESLLRGRDGEPGGSPAFTPPADAWETADAYVIQVELPGVREEDVELTVDGDELRLRGERRLPAPRPETFERLERSYGPFARSFRFAEEVDPERVGANFENGLLRLELRKLRAPRPERTE